ncbi:hypothetical protein ABZ814_15385, partial [Micromonospora musae]|uniref:hypothetical protein n=1 Tax=Micromonospora musae TaxID=1894970 RepID=UPI0033DFA213
MRTTELADGAIAGAVGSTVLNVVTYLDMALRGRPASSTPEQVVDRLAKIAHLSLGPADSAENRRSGLGPLIGYATGVAAGVGFALLSRGRRQPLALAGPLVGAGVMVMSNAPMTVLRITDPRTWSRLAPHRPALRGEDPSEVPLAT